MCAYVRLSFFFVSFSFLLSSLSPYFSLSSSNFMFLSLFSLSLHPLCIPAGQESCSATAAAAAAAAAAASAVQREERSKVLRERQNEERQRKLEELKQQVNKRLLFKWVFFFFFIIHSFVLLLLPWVVFGLARPIWQLCVCVVCV